MSSQDAAAPDASRISASTMQMIEQGFRLVQGRDMTSDDFLAMDLSDAKIYVAAAKNLTTSATPTESAPTLPNTSAPLAPPSPQAAQVATLQKVKPKKRKHVVVTAAVLLLFFMFVGSGSSDAPKTDKPETKNITNATSPEVKGASTAATHENRPESKPATATDSPKPTASTVTPAPNPAPSPAPAPPPAPRPAPQPAPAPVYRPQPVYMPQPLPTPAPTPTPATGGSIYYANCTAARAAGVAPLYAGEPGYRSALDRDSDGVACET